jgi:hypothetical protein
VIVEDVTPHKHKPTPLTGAVQHVGTQAARLRHTVVKNVHHAQKVRGSAWAGRCLLHTGAAYSSAVPVALWQTIAGTQLCRM